MSKKMTFYPEPLVHPGASGPGKGLELSQARSQSRALSQGSYVPPPASPSLFLRGRQTGISRLRSWLLKTTIGLVFHGSVNNKNNIFFSLPGS